MNSFECTLTLIIPFKACYNAQPVIGIFFHKKENIKVKKNLKNWVNKKRQDNKQKDEKNIDIKFSFSFNLILPCMKVLLMNNTINFYSVNNLTPNTCLCDKFF